MSKLFILLVALPILTQAVHMRAPRDSLLESEGNGPNRKGKGLPSKPTLREFLKSEKFHVSMAPLFYISRLIHMSVLNVLKQNDLPIASLSGTSTGGLVAATWGSMDHKHKGYAQTWGQKLSWDDCYPNCDKYQKFYLNYLDSHMNSEVDAEYAIASPEAVETREKDMWLGLAGSRKKIGMTESRQGYALWAFWMELFKVPVKFSDTRLPVAITAFHHNDAKDKDFSVLMGNGNLHLAIMGTTNTKQNGLPVVVDDEYTATDGFFGDEHGARGYDALDAKKRPASMLTILPLDTPLMPIKIMDFSKLKSMDQLKQAVTVFMYVRQPMNYQKIHMKKAEQGERHFTNRDLMLAVHESWTRALDSPLDLDKAHPQLSKNLAYYKELDHAPYYPEFDYVPAEESLESGLDTFRYYRERFSKAANQTLGPMGLALPAKDDVELYEAEAPEAVEVECVDKTNLLQGEELNRMAKRFARAAQEMYGGEEFHFFKETLDSNMLPEQELIDLEKKNNRLEEKTHQE